MFTVGCFAREARAAPKASRAKAGQKSFEELGQIPWHRDEQAALADARKSGKPLMVFSTELPGCGSCKKFGKNHLSNPIIIDAAAHFVPFVLVKARTWPTMFFRTPDGKDLIPKVGFSRSVGRLLDGMERALRAAKKPVPAYLELAAREHRCRKPQKATFGMGCFWSGEAKLGAVDGVIASRCGFLKGEVVELTFDPKVISYAALVEKARELRCASFVVARTDEQLKIATEIISQQPKAKVIRSDAAIRPAAKDTKYHLRRHRRYYLLPLTELQAARVNSALAVKGGKPDTYLSPTQIAFLKQLKGLSDEQVKPLSLQPARSSDAVAAYAAALRLKLKELASRDNTTGKK